jgi:nucleotide-binding universal stress UspA family protein
MIVERRGRIAPSVLLPLDGTPQSHAAIPVAKAIAELTNTALHVVYVAQQALPPEELKRKLALTEEQLAGMVLDAAEGLPAEGIVRRANERYSLLIVMAMHNGSPLPDTGLGDVATEVVNRAPCPVLLVPPGRIGDTWNMGAVLLPQNGTPETAAAVELVAHLAHRAGAELLVLHVSETEAPPPAEPGSFTVPRYLDQPQHEWPAWTGEFVDRVRGLANLPEDFALRFFLAQGEPGSEIVRLAQEHRVDLIVLPWHESLEPERAATLKAVIRDPPCPVLILPFSKTRPLHVLERT